MYIYFHAQLSFVLQNDCTTWIVGLIAEHNPPYNFYHSYDLITFFCEESVMYPQNMNPAPLQTSAASYESWGIGRKGQKGVKKEFLDWVIQV